MTKIRIGADELILWLRKNNKAKGVPNDESTGLGRKIYELIMNQLGGEKVKESYPAYWANLSNDKNIAKLGLPKTSAQYEINVSELERLYVELNNW